MDLIILVYKCDNWHTHNSKFIIGVCDNYVSIKKICKKYAKANSEKFKKSNFDELLEINQTQKYSGDGEFIIEEVSLNTLLQ